MDVTFKFLPITANTKMEQAATEYHNNCGSFFSSNAFTWAGCYGAMVSAAPDSKVSTKPDSWYDVEVIDALVRRLDVAINGEKGAARQAMLCDLVAQLEVEELPAIATANEPILGYKHTMFMEGGQTQVRLTESGVNPFGVGGKDYSKEYNVISIPLSLHKDSVGTKIQRITKQDVMTIAWSASFSLGVKYGRDLHEALKKWWEWEDTGDTLLARLNERREPEQREIPVNDPIFYFVAQHYPLTAQIVERIYRECIHHCESREVK